MLTHCQLLHPSTVAAMARLGVVANVQPQFIPSALGPTRHRPRDRCFSPWLIYFG